MPERKRFFSIDVFPYHHHRTLAKIVIIIIITITEHFPESALMTLFMRPKPLLPTLTKSSDHFHHLCHHHRHQSHHQQQHHPSCCKGGLEEDESVSISPFYPPLITYQIPTGACCSYLLHICKLYTYFICCVLKCIFRIFGGWKYSTISIWIREWIFKCIANTWLLLSSVHI